MRNMYVTNINNVEEVELKRKGARGVKMKHLLHRDIGAERLQLRLFIIEIGGHTPLERHRHEHEVFILKGKALVKSGDAEKVVGEGDVIFIQSWEEHQFRNICEEKVYFLCTKETLG